MNPTRSLRILIALTAGVLVHPASPATAQGIEGWHIVRPGDTLYSLAADHLGAATRWRELAELNPDLADPNLLTPGEFVRVRRESTGSRLSARIESISRRVEVRPTPVPWGAARREELLVPDDGVRTFQDASAEIGFESDRRLVLTEESLAFLRVRDFLPEGEAAPPAEVEIVEGQADLEARLSPVEAVGVEILVGGARARPATGDDGQLRTRARRDEAGSAALMVYEGASEVAAAGQTVAVPRGSGTVVPESGPPAPPTPLLPAPELAQPASAFRADFANVTFAWQPVAGATSYTLEICADEDCASLVQRVAGVGEPSWTSPGTDVGDHFWRVTARDAGGLDGYPSEPRELSVLSDALDRRGPAAALDLSGTMLRVGDALYVAEDVAVSLAATDEQSGIGRSLVNVNGSAVEALDDHPWTDGSYALTGSSHDRAGNATTIEPLDFIVDTKPPEIEWQIVDERIVERMGDPVTVPGRVRRAHQRWADEGLAWLEWTDSGRRWIPLAWGADSESTVWRSLARQRIRPVGNGVYSSWEIVNNEPQLLLIAPGAAPFAAGGPQLGQDQLLWISIRDSGCGVERAALRTRQASGGGSVLEIEATDYFGHSANVQWPLTAQTRKERKRQRTGAP